MLRDCPLVRYHMITYLLNAHCFQPRNPQVINQNRIKFEANTPQLSKRCHLPNVVAFVVIFLSVVTMPMKTISVIKDLLTLFLVASGERLVNKKSF